MSFAQLTLPFGLRAMSIESRAYRIGIGGLLPALMLDSDEEFVIVPEALIITADDQVIVGGLFCAPAAPGVPFQTPNSWL